MSFTDVIKESVLDGFRTGDLSTISMAVTLAMAAAMGLFIYVVYRLTAKGSFYNQDFNKSLATLPVITAGILLAMQSNLVISLGIIVGAGWYELAVLLSLAATGWSRWKPKNFGRQPFPNTT